MEKKNNKIVYILVGIVLLAFPFAAEKVFNWNYGVLLANFMILYIVAVSGLDILFG